MGTKCVVCNHKGYVVGTQMNDGEIWGFNFCFIHYQCNYAKSILQFETHFKRTQSSISQMVYMENIMPSLAVLMTT